MVGSPRSPRISGGRNRSRDIGGESQGGLSRDGAHGSGIDTMAKMALIEPLKLGRRQGRSPPDRAEKQPWRLVLRTAPLPRNASGKVLKHALRAALPANDRL